MAKEAWENGRAPLWYRVLKEFGFPTVVCIALSVGFVHYYKNQTALASSFLEVLNKMDSKLEKLVESHE